MKALILRADKRAINRQNYLTVLAVQRRSTKHWRLNCFMHCQGWTAVAATALALSDTWCREFHRILLQDLTVWWMVLYIIRSGFATSDNWFAFGYIDGLFALQIETAVQFHRRMRSSAIADVTVVATLAWGRNTANSLRMRACRTLQKVHETNNTTTELRTELAQKSGLMRS